MGDCLYASAVKWRWREGHAIDTPGPVRTEDVLAWGMGRTVDLCFYIFKAYALPYAAGITIRVWVRMQ